MSKNNELSWIFTSKMPFLSKLFDLLTLSSSPWLRISTNLIGYIHICEKTRFLSHVYSTEVGKLPVSIKFNSEPVWVLQNLVDLSAIPPTVMSRLLSCGDQSNFFTAARWSVRVNLGKFSPQFSCWCCHLRKKRQTRRRRRRRSSSSRRRSSSSTSILHCWQ